MCSISFGLVILIMRVLSKLFMIIGLFDKKYQKNRSNGLKICSDP